MVVAPAGRSWSEQKQHRRVDSSPNPALEIILHLHRAVGFARETAREYGRNMAQLGITDVASFETLGVDELHEFLGFTKEHASRVGAYRAAGASDSEARLAVSISDLTAVQLESARIQPLGVLPPPPPPSSPLAARHTADSRGWLGMCGPSSPRTPPSRPTQAERRQEHSAAVQAAADEAQTLVTQIAREREAAELVTQKLQLEAEARKENMEGGPCAAMARKQAALIDAIVVKDHVHVDPPSEQQLRYVARSDPFVYTCLLLICKFASSGVTSGRRKVVRSRRCRHRSSMACTASRGRTRAGRVTTVKQTAVRISTATSLRTAGFLTATSSTLLKARVKKAQKTVSAVALCAQRMGKCQRAMRRMGCGATGALLLQA